MRSVARVIVVAVALGLPLGGCGTMTPDFDPMDWLAGDWFGTKKPLPGERKPVFPEGVPGVARGVPSELMKDGQRAQEIAAEQQAAAAAQEAAVREEPKPKPKARPKPKPKTVATSDPQQSAPRASVPPRQPAQQQQVQWPDPPQQSRPQPQSQIQWPDPPPPR